MQRSQWILASLLGAAVLSLAPSSAAWQCPGGYPPPPKPGSGTKPPDSSGGSSGVGASNPAPGAPATPAPAAPARPAPTKATPAPASTPKSKPGVATATPMPSGPTSAGAPTGTSKPAPFTDPRRGPSARKELKLAWDHPIAVSSGFERSDATAVAERRALSVEQALRAIAGKDPRPLLVLRECSKCANSEKALLVEGFDNERTFLLARWFHCVKLPVDVVQPDHPFHALFPDKTAGHLFVSQVDGSGRVALEGDLPRSELWASMARVLTDAYGKDPTATTRDMGKLFDKLDTLDVRERELQKRRDELIEASGRSEKSKLDDVNQDLQSVQREIASLLSELGRLAQLEPLPRAEPAPVR
ncbi:MAG: hypothetical protein IPJ77_23820 [Planctomycetes bacterium]|nr:hypothetical protein [Planctomycetota bacterium]